MRYEPSAGFGSTSNAPSSSGSDRPRRIQAFVGLVQPDASRAAAPASRHPATRQLGCQRRCVATDTGLPGRHEQGQPQRAAIGEQRRHAGLHPRLPECTLRGVAAVQAGAFSPADTPPQVGIRSASAAWRSAIRSVPDRPATSARDRLGLRPATGPSVVRDWVIELAMPQWQAGFDQFIASGHRAVGRRHLSSKPCDAANAMRAGVSVARSRCRPGPRPRPARAGRVSAAAGCTVRRRATCFPSSPYRRLQASARRW